MNLFYLGRKMPQLATIVFSLALVSACSGGTSNPPEAPDSSIPQDAPQNQVEPEENQTVLLEMIGDVEIGGNQTTELNEDLGDLLPRVFATETGVDLAYAQSGAALVQRINESLVLPADITVSFADCGIANAFFASASPEQGNNGPAIFICHELTALFADFFNNSEQAFLASVFVIMHELGHALVDQLDLPVLGIEESYVDGIAAVLTGEGGIAEANVLAGFFFGSQPNTPFFDSHRAGPQRLGDLACWAIGAKPSLLDDPSINGLAEQLMDGGRDCVSEYAQQVSGLTNVLSGNIRGGLGTDLDGILQ